MRRVLVTLILLVLLRRYVVPMFEKQCIRDSLDDKYQMWPLHRNHPIPHEPIGTTTLQSHNLDDRFPRYRTSPNHGLFIDQVRVGEGSCIYNHDDPSYDGVLPNWRCMNKWFKKAWKSPPLPSEVYNINLRKPEDCGCNPYV